MMRNDSSICPGDQAKLEFFQFIKSLDGRDLYDMFNIYDQPSESLWEHYNNWWTSNKVDWDNEFNPRGTLDNSWVRFIVWSSKMFMTAFMAVYFKISINPSMINGEELLWYATIMKNLVLDMKLATKLDSTQPKTWFQKVVNLQKEIFACEGNLARIHKVVCAIFPKLHRPVQHQLVKAEDMVFFKNHNINQIWDLPNLIVPKMWNLDENYRMKFGTSGKNKTFFPNNRLLTII